MMLRLRCRRWRSRRAVAALLLVVAATGSACLVWAASRLLPVSPRAWLLSQQGSAAPPFALSFIACTSRTQFLPNLWGNFQQQRLLTSAQPQRLELVVVFAGPATTSLSPVRCEDEAVQCLFRNTTAAPSLGQLFNAGVAAGRAALWAKFDDDDYYGPFYGRELLDVFAGPVPATRPDLVGKRNCYYYFEGSDLLYLRQWIRPRDQSQERFSALFPHGIVEMAWVHKTSLAVQGATLAGTQRSFWRLGGMANQTTGEDSDLLRRARAAGLHIFSTTPHNYAVVRREAKQGGAGAGHTWHQGMSTLLRYCIFAAFGLDRQTIDCPDCHLPQRVAGRERRRTGHARLDRTPTPAAPFAARAPEALPPLLEPGPVPELRIALIADEMTQRAVAREAAVLLLRPDGWAASLHAFKPNVLLAESLWSGQAEEWRLHVRRGKTSAEIQGILAWCRQRSVPAVFWNKEDPPSFDRFAHTARLFDHVLTTDRESIPRYLRLGLRPDQVHVQPFFASPLLHNPLASRRGRGAGDFVFLGSYSRHVFPRRGDDIDLLLDAAVAGSPGHNLTVYDRYALLPQYADRTFPNRFRPYIRPSLPYLEVLGAYKAYKAVLNANSVRNASSTMYSRRVVEAVASGAVVISTPGRGMSTAFGPEHGVYVVDSPTTARNLMDGVAGAWRQFASSAGFRKVLSTQTTKTFLHHVTQVASRPWSASLFPLQRLLVVATRRVRSVDDCAAFASQAGAAFQRLTLGYSLARLVIFLDVLHEEPAELCQQEAARSTGVDLADRIFIEVGRVRNPQHMASRGLGYGVCHKLLARTSAERGPHHGYNWLLHLDPDQAYPRDFVRDALLSFHYTSGCRAAGLGLGVGNEHELVSRLAERTHLVPLPELRKLCNQPHPNWHAAAPAGACSYAVARAK